MLRKVVLWPILFFFIALAFFFADTDRVHAAAELIDYDVPEKISMTADPRTGQLTVEPLIINNTGAYDLSVDSLQVMSQNGWELVPAQTDFAKMPKDAKRFSLVAGGNHDLASACRQLGVISCPPQDSTMTIALSGRTGAASEAHFDEQAADLLLTVSRLEPEYEDFTVTIANRGMIGYTDETTELVIPETFRAGDGTWYKTIGIGLGAFSGCGNLEKVVVPRSVTSISDNAFSYCHNLRAVNIPQGVTEIKRYTFYECTSLKEIRLPDTLRLIDDSAFSYSGLTAVEIPAGVAKIVASFQFCEDLQTIRIARGEADDLSLPAGTFYSAELIDTVIVTENEIVRSYDWAADNRKAVFAELIPPGGVYTAADGQKLTAGDVFPLPQTGDKYEFGDYIYTYDDYSDDGLAAATNWHAAVRDRGKAVYADVLNEISGRPVDNLAYTFAGCENLLSAPLLPESVTVMAYTFYGCQSLGGEIEILSRPEVYEGCFAGTWEAIYLFGTEDNFDILFALTGTATSGNVFALR